MRSVTIKHQDFDESRQYFSCSCRELSIKSVFNVNIFVQFMAILIQAFEMHRICQNDKIHSYPLALYKRSFHALLRKVFFCLMKC
jgi:hypothetical protein